jgi:hypothetical protein
MPESERKAGRRKIRASSYEGWNLWSCVMTADGCKVRVFMDATELWQTIAEVSASRETVLDIVKMVELLNRERHRSEDIRPACAVLRSLEEEGLNFATEMELEHVIKMLGKGGAGTA